MVRIGTLAQSMRTLQFLQQTQSQTRDVEAQIATGLKSQSFAGIPTDAARLVNLGASKAHHQAFIDSIDVLDTRLKTMDLVASKVQDLAAQFSEKLPNSAFDTAGPSIQQIAQQLLVEVGAFLNTRDGSRYIFAGDKTAVPPFDGSGLPSPGDLATSVGSAPPGGYYQGDGGIAQAAIDDGVTLKYGVTGDNPAFEQIVRVLNFFATSGPLDQNDPADTANVAKAAQLINDSLGKLQQVRGIVSLQSAQLGTTRKTHQDVINLVQTDVAGIVKADPAEAISRLNTLQVQLQASFQTVSVLQSLSLANYLK